MYTYHTILRRLEPRVRLFCIHQVLDNSRPDHGAFLTSGGGGHPTADHCGNAANLAIACYLFFAKGSTLEGDDDPDEFHNLWDAPEAQEQKQVLIKRSFDASMCVSDPGSTRIGRY